MIWIENCYMTSPVAGFMQSDFSLLCLLLSDTLNKYIKMWSPKWQILMACNGIITRKLSTSRLPINSMPITLPLSNFGTVIKYPRYSTFGASLVKEISPIIGLGHFMGSYSCKAVHRCIYPVQTTHIMESFKAQVKYDHMEEPILTEKMEVDSRQRVPENINHEDNNKIQRKKKTGHSNKGRVPWNKGRKHSEETRARIRQRTKEALKDPKVRKKMSDCPRTLSNQTKAKIQASLTKLWGIRLQWKRSTEEFLKSWAESIAITAKVGGRDQEELEWDSYDKIKREIALLQLHQAAEKVKAKDAARIQAERAAQIKAEKMARLAQKRREREENAKVRGEYIRKRNKKSKEEKEKLAEFQEVKLKERLMKIHRKKSTVNQVNNQRQRSWEKLDLDMIKREQLQKEIPLADQIRFAKNRSKAAS